MKKLAYFFFDDVIWTLRDLARERPASIFDHFFLKDLKHHHEAYGAKFQLNLFYRTDFYYGNDEFTLADMPDAYKAEFEAASDWLKFAVHSKQEFPDYPFVNMDYKDAYEISQAIMNEIRRFAGENSITYGMTPHWGPASLDACRAFRDCGVRMMWASAGETQPYNGDPDSLPYGHAARLLNNRKPETMLFTRNSFDVAITRSVCGYNHLSTEEGAATLHSTYLHYDPKTDLYFRDMGLLSPLNTYPSIEVMEQDLATGMDYEFLSVATHEQYSYQEYYGYLSDHGERIRRACEMLYENGFTFIYADELVPN